MALSNPEVESLGKELTERFSNLLINHCSDFQVIVEMKQGYSLTIKPIKYENMSVYACLLKLNGKIECINHLGYGKKYKICHSRENIIEEIARLNNLFSKTKIIRMNISS